VGTAATKSRGKVEGSTRKLYRQKGTGNARMGPVRTPSRRGGGRAFAKDARDFRKHMPKRMRRLACRNALLAKILAHDVIILEDLRYEGPRTRDLRQVLGAVGATRGCLLAIPALDAVLHRSGRTIPRTDVRPISDLNAYDILRRRKVVFTKSAFQALASKDSA
jgi:large subunit ribosomal protein L4